jgi:hypothetical protein
VAATASMCKAFMALIACACLSLIAQSARASDYLLYLEAQEIFGYSSSLGKTLSYSINPQSEMQQPSLGFDYLQRVSGDSGDIAVLALQGRISVMPPQEGAGYQIEPRPIRQEKNGYTLQPQIFNAWVKFKTPWAYIWVGHDRPAFGLASYLDSHGLLLETVGMRFGFYDRDWGVGGYHDFSWGNVAASLTTGSGMPLYQGMPDLPFDSHYMAVSRVSYGVLERDNYNVGFSLGFGKTLETTGYTLMEAEPFPMQMVGTDLAVLQDNFEHRFELYSGKWFGSNLIALFYRFGVNLDPEARYKLEAQDMYWENLGIYDHRPSLCFSYQVTPNFTVRTSYAYDNYSNDNRTLLQLYYYGPWHL